MVKKCIYCGQSLLSEEARFCHACGRMQISPSDSANGAAPTLMKVKLPPKEFSRSDQLPFSQQDALPPVPGRETILPSHPEQRPSNLNRRTAYQRVQEQLARNEQFKGPSGFAPVHTGAASADKFSAREATGWVEEQEEFANTYPLSGPIEIPEFQETSLADDLPPTPRVQAKSMPDQNGFAHSEFSSPASSDKISAMPIPNWQENSDEERGEHPMLNSSYIPEKSSIEFDQELPPTPRPSRQDLPPTPRPSRYVSSFISSEETYDSEQTADLSHSSTPWSNVPRDERAPSPEAFQQTMRTREREQNPNDHLSLPPMEWATPVARPLMAQPPLSPFPFTPEEQLDPEEDMTSMNTIQQRPQSPMEWSTPVSRSPMAQPPLSPFSSTPEEQLDPEEDIAALDTIHEQAIVLKKEHPFGTTAEEQTSPADQQNDQENVEDLPTAPLAIPEEFKMRPQIVIERSSTPAPKKNAPRTVDAQIEDLPTSKVPTIPPSPVPHMPTAPAAQRVSQSTARPLNPENGSAIPPSRPGSIPAGLPPINATPLSGAPQIPEQPDGQNAPSSPINNLNVQPDQRHNSPSLPGLAYNSSPQQSNSTAPRPENLRAQSQGQSTFPPISMSTPDTPQPDPAQIAAALKKSGKKKHPGWLIVAVLLVLILAGGAIIYQYFTITSTPQPDQPYQNSSLGFSLRYPQGWKVQENQAIKQVIFADSSHTGQTIVEIGTVDGMTLNTYTSNETSHLKITGAKTLTPISFARATWQQVKGNVEQEGVTYTITLYTTQRNAQFYALAFQAPPSSYDEMEKDDFSPLRVSFIFL